MSTNEVVVASAVECDSLARATLLYLTLVSGSGRAVAYIESMAGRTDDPSAPLADPNPITQHLVAYEFGGMLLGAKHVDSQSFRWPFHALGSILAQADRLTIGGAGRRELRWAWIDAELQAMGGSLDEARRLSGQRTSG